MDYADFEVAVVAGGDASHSGHKEMLVYSSRYNSLNSHLGVGDYRDCGVLHHVSVEYPCVGVDHFGVELLSCVNGLAVEVAVEMKRLLQSSEFNVGVADGGDEETWQ
jgi:hypothetical protein